MQYIYIWDYSPWVLCIFQNIYVIIYERLLRWVYNSLFLQGFWGIFFVAKSETQSDSFSFDIFACNLKISYLYFFLQILFIYSWETHKERVETQAEREAGSMQEARCGTRSRDSRITPWAEGKHSTAEPPRRPSTGYFGNAYVTYILLTLSISFNVPTYFLPEPVANFAKYILRWFQYTHEINPTSWDLLSLSPLVPLCHSYITVPLYLYEAPFHILVSELKLLSATKPSF